MWAPVASQLIVMVIVIVIVIVIVVVVIVIVIVIADSFLAFVWAFHADAHACSDRRLRRCWSLCHSNSVG